ncbi:hypothetical protein [Singulisphaera sp. PoT]|uniref:hypothetical protein n=1 Tax=Singulisphaera sp. PoT TaxID=3411797 RepID=UPI003BF4DD5D
MRESNEPKPSDKVKFTEGFDALYTLMAVHAICILPFMRRGVGVRAYAFGGPIGLVAMFCFAGFAKCTDMLAYMAAWLFAVIFQRTRSDRSVHSLYQGDPALVMRFLRVRDRRMAFLVEPFLVLWVGLTLRHASEPLGLFVACGFISLVFVHLSDLAAMSRRVRRMHDAAIEQEAMAERFRHNEW